MKKHFHKFLEGVRPVVGNALVESIANEFDSIFEEGMPQVGVDPQMASAPTTTVPPAQPEVGQPEQNPGPVPPQASSAPVQSPSPAIEPAAPAADAQSPAESPATEPVSELAEISETQVIRDMSKEAADKYDVMLANPEAKDAFWNHLRQDPKANKAISGKNDDAKKKWVESLVDYFSTRTQE